MPIQDCGIEIEMSREFIHQLSLNNKMATDAQIQAFLRAFDQLRDRRTINDCMLPYLLHIFDDDCEQSDVMESFLTFVLYYSSEDIRHYVHILVKETPYLLNKAEIWLIDLYRVLLHEKANSKILQEELEQLPADIRKMIIGFLISKLPRYLSAPSEKNLMEIVNELKK